MLTQGSESWLAKRRECITSSDAAVILGLNPWISPRQLWEMKKGLRAESATTEAMERGKRMEPIARAWLEKQFGLLLHAPVVFSDERTWQMASLDAITLDDKHLFEIKCGEKSFAQAVKGEIAPYYMAQMQHQMCVCGLPSMTYLAFDGKTGIPLEVKRDDDYIKNLIEEEEKFYALLQRDEPPPEVEKNIIKVVAEPQALPVVEKFCQAYRRMKEAEAELKALRPLLIDLGDDGDFDVVDEGGSSLVELRCVTKEGVVDWKGLCAAHGIDVAEQKKFRKPESSYYKVVPTGEK